MDLPRMVLPSNVICPGVAGLPPYERQHRYNAMRSLPLDQKAELRA